MFPGVSSSHFSFPEIGGCSHLQEQNAWETIPGQWEQASSSIGHIISLENDLCTTGFQDIDRYFLPKVQQQLKGCHTRVMLGYATLMWFTSKVTSYHL